MATEPVDTGEGIHISNFSPQTRKQRWPDPEQQYFFTNAQHILWTANAGYPGYENPETSAGPPYIALWRMNLVALSQKFNLYFVASRDSIHIYVPRDLKQTLPARPDVVIDLPVSIAASKSQGYIDPSIPHCVNHMILGNLGDMEILLMCCDDGDVLAFYTHHIQAEIDRPNDKFRIREILPFFHANVGVTAWGLAIHEKSRLMAVSSNRKEVHIFAPAISDGGDDSMDEDESVSDETFPFTDEFRDANQPRSFNDRMYNFKLCVALGDLANNIPAITFTSDENGGAHKVIACDIDGNAWLLDPWGGQKRRLNCGDVRNGGYSHVAGGQRSWGVLCLAPENFRLTGTLQEAWNVEHLTTKDILYSEKSQHYNAYGDEDDEELEEEEIGDSDEESHDNENASTIEDEDDDDIESEADTNVEDGGRDSKTVENVCINITPTVEDIALEYRKAKEKPKPFLLIDRDACDADCLQEDGSSHAPLSLDGSGENSAIESSEDDISSSEVSGTFEDEEDVTDDNDIDDASGVEAVNDEHDIETDDDADASTADQLSGSLQMDSEEPVEMTIEEWENRRRPKIGDDSIRKAYDARQNSRMQYHSTTPPVGSPEGRTLTPAYSLPPRPTTPELEALLKAEELRQYKAEREAEISLLFFYLQLPPDVRKTIKTWRELDLKKLTCEAQATSLPDSSINELNHPRLILLRTYHQDIELVQPLNPSSIPTRLMGVNLSTTNRGLDRYNLVCPIPELGIVLIGTQSGRVVILTLTQIPDPSRVQDPFLTFRMDALLPLQQHLNEYRPRCPLLGMAVSPVHGRMGREERRVIGRRWRVMLHFYDHTVLSYELGWKGSELMRFGERDCVAG